MPETFTLVRLLNSLLMGVEVKAFQSIGVGPAEAADKAVKVNQALGWELVVVAGLIALLPCGASDSFRGKAELRHSRSPN